MINRRCRRCTCMNNNPQCYNKTMLETSCNNTCTSMNYNDSCDCGFEEEMDVFPSNPMLAQSYVPFQYMEDTFKPCTGLEHGTIFPELVSPYQPGDSMKDIDFIRKTNTIGEGCNSCR